VQGSFICQRDALSCISPAGGDFVSKNVPEYRLVGASGPKSCKQNFGLPAGLLQAFKHVNRTFNVDLIFGEDQCRALESGDRQLFQ